MDRERSNDPRLRCRGEGPRGAAVIAAEGDVLASWPTGMTNPWGVGYDGGVWLSDFEDIIDVHFSTDGERGDEFDVAPRG